MALPARDCLVFVHCRSYIRYSFMFFVTYSYYVVHVYSLKMYSSVLSMNENFVEMNI